MSIFTSILEEDVWFILESIPVLVLMLLMLLMLVSGPMVISILEALFGYVGSGKTEKVQMGGTGLEGGRSVREDALR